MIFRNRNYYPDGNEKSLFYFGNANLLTHWKYFTTTTKFNYQHIGKVLISVEKSESFHLLQHPSFVNCSMIMSSNDNEPFAGTENISSLLDTI